eukprot:CCRYP_016373-RD/>CCRYP_016373-RD protein AED:0.41 eAED:0.41 QI:0/0.5/0/1/1/1/3/0/754
MKMAAVDVNDVVEVVNLENDTSEYNPDGKEFEAFAVDGKLKSPPQDQIPAFNTNEVSMSTTCSGSPTDSRSSKSRDWVSPNKSSETENEAFESGSTLSDRTATRDNKSPSDKIESQDLLDLEYSSDLEDANDAKCDLSVIGNGLNTLVFDQEFKPKAVVPPLGLSHVCEPELQINASGKDWIKVVHDSKEKMIALPARGSLDMGTFEIAETLSAAFNVSDDVEIVGLTAGVIFTEDDDKKLKHHCDIVIPLSFLTSGQLKQIVEASESIPAFRLVTKTFGPFTGQQRRLETEFDGTSYEEDSYGEERVFSDAFVDVMENSDVFTPLEKNVLLRFGIGEVKRGNILYRAAFRVAVFTESPSYFEKGLKAIASVLLGDNNAKEVAKDINCPQTIFSLIEFVEVADDLLSCSDLTNEQYVALVDAIYSGHPEVEKIFDLHCCPDFLLACDSEDFRVSLLTRELLSLAKTLPPIIAVPSDEQLKWAIHTGLHNFTANLSIAIPDEFRNIIYHMFSSGDEIILSACKDFVLTNDSKCVESMILREWNIYCHNRDRFFVPTDMKDFDSTQETIDSGFDAKDQAEVPDLLLTAVAALVDLEEITEDEAAAIVALYMKGNVRLRDIYENFIKNGDTEDFLHQLKIASFDKQFMSSRAFASPTPTKFNDDQALLEFDAAISKSKEHMYNVFRNALESIKLGDNFDALEVSALRLATVRRDAFLSNALRYYIETKDNNTFFRDLKYVAEKIIYETDASLESVSL